jgi:hypothetical protein
MSVTDYNDLGNIPGQDRLYLTIVRTTSRTGPSSPPEGRRSLCVMNRDFPARTREICSVEDGRLVIDPVPGTGTLSEAEQLAFKAMPASHGLRKDLQALLKDPFWQAAVDLLLVEHVMES